MTGPLHRIRLALASAALFVVALALALVIDQEQEPAPVVAVPAPTATTSASALASGPRAKPTPRSDRRAERRRERRREHRPPNPAPTRPPTGDDRPAWTPSADSADSVLDEWAEDQATAWAGQNERVQATMDAGTALELTRAAETIERTQETAAAEVQEMCEPRCLDSPRDAYP